MPHAPLEDRRVMYEQSLVLVNQTPRAGRTDEGSRPEVRLL